MRRCARGAPSSSPSPSTGARRSAASCATRTATWWSSARPPAAESAGPGNLHRSGHVQVPSPAGEDTMNRLTAGAGAVAVLLLAACGGTTGKNITGATGTGAMTTGTVTKGTVMTGTGTATVTGRFLIEGGPLRPGGGQPGERPLRGTVTFTAIGERTVSIPVGRS